MPRLRTIQTPTPISITTRTRWTYGSGGVIYGVVSSATYFALLFYSQVLGLSPQVAGLALGIGFFINAVADPLVGYLSDHTRSRTSPFAMPAEIVSTCPEAVRRLLGQATYDNGRLGWYPQQHSGS